MQKKWTKSEFLELILSQAEEQWQLWGPYIAPTKEIYIKAVKDRFELEYKAKGIEGIIADEARAQEAYRNRLTRCLANVEMEIKERKKKNDKDKKPDQDQNQDKN